jgi:predicted nucleic acid-binding protein
VTGLTLDAGALIALERGDRSVRALVARAFERGDPITIPATALAQVIRTPVPQARLMRLCRQPQTRVAPLDRADAIAAGVLLGRTQTTDIADAHVVVCARRAGQAVVASDPDDLAALAPELRIVPVS